MKIRRVVTGHDENGKAVFVSDEEVEPLVPIARPGSEYHRLWGSDTAPTFPDRGEPTPQPTFFPPVGGYRFLFFTIPPEGSAAAPDIDPEAAAADVEEKLPGMGQWMEADDPGMHTTDTIDFEVVISGEVTLELDDGAEKVLRAGDTNVQNGTRHRWHNRGSEPVVIAVFIAGAHRASRGS
jgi:mannose-6-phosphate isomerase-like protein (cupin superfamily)